MRALDGVSTADRARRDGRDHGPVGVGQEHAAAPARARSRRRRRGTIALAGRRFEGLDDQELTLLRREAIGFVFQFFNLLPALTAEENVLLPALIAGRRDDAMRERAVELLERVGLGAARRAPALRALRRRAAARLDRAGAADGARARARRRADRQPRLALRAREILELLSELNRDEGHTIVMVTHDPGAAATAGRVVFLRDGRIAGEVEGGRRTSGVDRALRRARDRSPSRADLRSFYSLALRQVRARRLRALLTAAGIVLGVGMICGVLLLAATIQRTFTDLFDSVYGETDLVVSGSESTGPCRRRRCAQVRRDRGRGGGARATSSRVFTWSRSRASGAAAVAERLPRTLPRRRRRSRRSPTRRPAQRRRRRAGTSPTSPTPTDLGPRARERARDRGPARAGPTRTRSRSATRSGLPRPSGIARFEVVGPLPVLDRARLRRRGVRDDAARAPRANVMDKPRGFDEISVVGRRRRGQTIVAVQAAARAQAREGASRSTTPDAKADEVEKQLQALQRRSSTSSPRWRCSSAAS